MPVIATGFPGVIGCIDCSHIAIVRPSINEAAYFNHNRFHSINVQVAHCISRNCVERLFGVMKTEWRCLLKDRVLHYCPLTAGTGNPT
ncbi:putative nuclease HARBI1 [Bacillus rossius redtenbacheri]|uniref:putative nuclease HARBI1 n=1 Tax=Bacillus rossius redtenbacheri TaxID=93214 RepID=UPI002FDE6016